MIDWSYWDTWVGLWVGILIGVVSNRIWMAFDLDRKLPGLRKPKEE
jgi:hypothetical protein